MSKISLFNDIFREPWMIEPQTAIAQKQVLHGLLMGLEFAPEDDTVQTVIGHKQHKAIPQGHGISVVNLEGVMLRDDGPCGMIGTRTLAAELLEADGVQDIIGHIIRIDSGGGAANSVPDLADAIKACTKPVVAFVDGYMCSAAMYVGSYCQHIIAFREDNKIGCIGTMIQLEDYPRQAKDSNGMMHLRIYADGADEKNGEYEAALEGDFKLMKERVLNPHNERFRSDIRANRPNVKEDQLKGRTYDAKDTLGTLIDAIGSFDTAVAKVIELSNLNITQMDGYKNLQSLETCHDLQMVEGYVSLNGEQMTEIDNALGQLDTEKALNKTHSDTVAEQLTEINELTAENETLKSEAAQKDARITELEAKEAELVTMTQERDTLKEEAAQKDAHIAELEKALDKDPNDEDPLPAMHNGNHDKPEDEFHELNDDEAMDYARKIVKREL